MCLHVEADELQRVDEDAIGFPLPLADAGTWFDVSRGRFFGQRKGNEAPAIEVNGGLIAPVASIVVFGGAPALAFGIFDLPENAPPTAVPLDPHAKGVWLAGNGQRLLQAQCGVFADDVWHFALALAFKFQFEARAFLGVVYLTNGKLTGPPQRSCDRLLIGDELPLGQVIHVADDLCSGGRLMVGEGPLARGDLRRGDGTDDVVHGTSGVDGEPLAFCFQRVLSSVKLDLRHGGIGWELQFHLTVPSWRPERVDALVASLELQCVRAR